jgi:hypothetical protein
VRFATGGGEAGSPPDGGDYGSQAATRKKPTSRSFGGFSFKSKRVVPVDDLVEPSDDQFAAPPEADRYGPSESSTELEDREAVDRRSGMQGGVSRAITLTISSR